MSYSGNNLGFARHALFADPGAFFLIAHEPLPVRKKGEASSPAAGDNFGG